MLIVSVKDNLQSLIDLLHQLSEQQYNKPSEALSDVSIGKHYRHIIEMFICLLEGYEKGLVNYDQRERNQLIETNIQLALQKLSWLIDEVEKPNQQISLQQSLDDEIPFIKSNYYRELLYNLDHTIHHQALIKIGVAQYDNILLDEDFGVAPSTMNYRKNKA